jgi:hypothetical protein
LDVDPEPWARASCAKFSPADCAARVPPRINGQVAIESLAGFTSSKPPPVRAALGGPAVLIMSCWPGVTGGDRVRFAPILASNLRAEVSRKSHRERDRADSPQVLRTSARKPKCRKPARTNGSKSGTRTNADQSGDLARRAPHKTRGQLMLILTLHLGRNRETFGS